LLLIAPGYREHRKADGFPSHHRLKSGVTDIALFSVAAKSRRRVAAPHDISVRNPDVSVALNRQKSPKFAQMAVSIAVKVQPNPPPGY
jgi:hypothetical protein